MEKNINVGKYIISTDGDIGKIVDVVNLEPGAEDFFKVNFTKNNCINYFSMKNTKNYRILASKENVQKAIDIFNTRYEPIEYDSTHEKINAQKEALSETNICEIAKVLSMINQEKEVHPQVNKTYTIALGMFIDEIKFVTGKKLTDIYDLLKLKIPAKKGKK
ncbi:hypothetical protein M899_0999 [Bacteriovorax sp. BSW11_IV]|uniref:hypothetical protein n=1 Tax=Bacteriovorax sp. BSW11_IV TaxID=1353529 RepID=UPI00038A36FB|nr:hypothetical protein [Bacteriovorax sp. BSW11_IV]EQC48681.1 hypothetical protein M899_0999 [Bacteriovorax sp. BSW11_IV]